jgi:hypothetical protein
MRKFVMVIAVLGVIVWCYPNPAMAQLSWQNVSLNAGLGGAVPVSGSAFVDSTEGISFHKFVAVEYPVSDKFSLGVQYSGTDFGLESGSELETSDWGPYVHIRFDVIPENDFYAYLDFGVAENQGNTIAANWGALVGVGIEFDAKADARARIGIRLDEVDGTDIRSVMLLGSLVFEPFKKDRSQP